MLSEIVQKNHIWDPALENALILGECVCVFNCGKVCTKKHHCPLSISKSMNLFVMLVFGCVINNLNVPSLLERETWRTLRHQMRYAGISYRIIYMIINIFYPWTSMHRSSIYYHSWCDGTGWDAVSPGFVVEPRQAAPVCHVLSVYPFSPYFYPMVSSTPPSQYIHCQSH